MKFHLIAKGDEYRLTGFISETALSNHKKHGWRLVNSWALQPTPDAVRVAVAIEGLKP